MTQKDIEEAIDDYLDDNLSMDELTIVDAIKMFVSESVRDLFEMDDFDQCKTPEKTITYKNKKYKITIFSTGVCEVTNNHRILYWDNKVEEI